MFLEDLLGSRPGVFIGVTVVLLGFAAFMTGQAIAQTWRPARQVVLYSLLLAGVARFLTWSLFGGPLLSLPAYITAALLLTLIGLFAWRVTLVRKMVGQYPWLHERAGLFRYRRRES